MQDNFPDGKINHPGIRLGFYSCCALSKISNAEVLFNLL